MLKPRNALFGGRTNAAKLYHKVCNDEKILNYDFTSLYPSVQRDNYYLVGHPEIITENFEDINKYFGIIKCKILPPNSMYFPIIPIKIHNKLIFPLCMSCAQEMNQE